MANQVFANGRELACKAGAGKTICALPDVCMTPPENPATPPGVPVPYPNTGLASDTTDGSRSVQISGKEVMLKNKSYFKTSSGDEAGCAAKKGVVSSKNKGKVYFIDWSMDVKLEGENAVRHLDKTTNNHGSPTANEAVPWPFVDSMDDAEIKALCDKDKAQEKAACADYKPHKADGKDVCAQTGLDGDFASIKGDLPGAAKKASENPCLAARRCRLVPYKASPEVADGIGGCCPAQTGDHIVPKSSFFKDKFGGTPIGGWTYSMNKAPCMCTEGGSCSGTHGLRHTHHKTTSAVAHGKPVPFETEVKHCAKGAKAVAPQCNEECLAAQLREGHKDMGDPATDIKHSSTGKPDITHYDSLKQTIDQTAGKLGHPLPFP
ncbi:PAAR-like domain-containing protein [Variovorax sp.]|uniref:PAAR-like domain-containing protein n=1 Tax=Variovorax sp. TaxID=1871043 RepID=UPI002D6088A8|nr:PAAR-like domain-containing protein [Variovorax sp.]HYP84231.1 PAAR-like domain-containing protein [Variovorax sp.]